MKSEQNNFNKTNIIFVINNYSAKGGAERVLRDLTNQFINEHNIILVSYDKISESASYNLHKDVVWIKLGGKFNNKIIDYFSCTLKLFKLLFFMKNKSKVIGWLYLAYFPISLYKFLGFDKKTPYYASEHIIYNHYSFYQKLIINFSMSVLDKTAFVSDYAMSTFFRVKSSKKLVIPNILNNNKAISNKLISEKENFLFNNKKIKICSVGRLTNQKNFFEAIDTINLLIKSTDLKILYHIYGTGKFYDKLQKYISKYNLTQNVKLKGLVNSVPYSSYDFTFIPSKYETQCLVILESWNSLVPVFMYSELSKMLDFINPDSSVFLIENKTDFLSILTFIQNYNKYESSVKCVENLNYIYSQQKDIIQRWSRFVKE